MMSFDTVCVQEESEMDVPVALAEFPYLYDLEFQLWAASALMLSLMNLEKKI